MNDTAILYEILKKPLITEKSTTLQEYNQYVFEVDKDANKIQICKAMELAFPGRKVSKVRTINSKSLKRRFRGKFGTSKATKKAIISVVGEPIEMFTGA